MNYLIVPIRSRTASFRDPEFQNFHRSLLLPPPATCIGLAGAALGLAPDAAQDYFTEGEWQIGIAGGSEGMANDLWKYNDFKTGSILIREILYGNHFVLVYGHTDPAQLQRLKTSFLRPRFALSCGPSDSICTVDATGLRITDELVESRELVHCYAEGDIIEIALSTATEGGSASFSIRTTSTPIAQDLPVRFTYDNNGIRMLRQRRLISYVQYPTELPKPVPGINYTYEGPDSTTTTLFVPVFPL